MLSLEGEVLETVSDGEARGEVLETVSEGEVCILET